LSDNLVKQDLAAGHRSGFVALIGRPNVGKSTLVNAYVGQKVAIVSSKPQTTRNRLRGILTRPEFQIIFVDTPGMHSPSNRLGEYMVKAVREAASDADLALLVTDVHVLPTEEDRLAARLFAGQPTPVILVMNKMDLMRPSEIEEHTSAYLALGEFADWMMVSALRSHNLDDLLGMIVDRLPHGPRFFPESQVTDLTERFIASELVREQVLRLLHQEVPHAIAVVVEEFSQRPEGMTYIAAAVYVEKESQKGIVIGAGGKMLKTIGMAARQEVERALGIRAYLDLRVKVRPKWRRDDVSLRQVGYPL